VKALNLKGIYMMKENERFYPKRDLAAHVSLVFFVDLDEKVKAASSTRSTNRFAARAKRFW